MHWDNMPVVPRNVLHVELEKKKNKRNVNCKLVSFYYTGDFASYPVIDAARIRALHRRKGTDGIKISSHTINLNFIEEAISMRKDTTHLPGYIERIFRSTKGGYYHSNGLLLEFLNRFDRSVERRDTIWLKRYPDNFCYNILIEYKVE